MQGARRGRGNPADPVRRPHPILTGRPSTRLWTAALEKAWLDAGIPAVAGNDAVIGVGVAAQQHGMVALDRANVSVLDALLWNDTRSAEAAAAMRDELGPEAWIEASNVVPVASFTLSKLAWLARHEPAAADAVARVVLPHDWLNFQLSGSFSTDRSDASGTAYFNAVTNEYRTDLLQRFFGRIPDLPPVLEPSGRAGLVLRELGARAPVLSAGAGDNAGAALGLGSSPARSSVSIGTSGTVFTTSQTPRGITGGTMRFADATGNHLPLLAMINSARVLAASPECWPLTWPPLIAGAGRRPGRIRA